MTDAHVERLRRGKSLSGFIGDRKSVKSPSYDRVIGGLSDQEILDEIAGGRGEVGFQEALRATAKKRGLKLNR